MATALPKLPAIDSAQAALKERLATALDRVRRRTLSLVEQLSDDALNVVHDPLMSPVAWDLGHIANFEELWLVRRAGGCQPLRGDIGNVYDAFTAPRPERGSLQYLRGDDCRAYMEAVRERALECLERADLSPDRDRLLAGGFVYELILRHEQQHTETILQTLQIMTSEEYRPQRLGRTPSPQGDPPAEMVVVPAGECEIGALPQWFAYDNELPQHVRDLPPFWIDTAPVTNREFAEFVEDDGYQRRELWSADGWDWRAANGITQPLYWEAGESEQAGLLVRSFAELKPLDPQQPVCHVSWFEADAFARYAGKRLPTEAEWEKAASWDPAGGDKRRYPWGETADARHANLDQLAFGAAPVGAYPAGRSAVGAHQMMGDVWEWTASGFERYDGFEAFPYAEYSEVFFGGPYRVLRGGSWATQPDAVTTAFRNWDHPDRRQIFAGFRCARDAEPGEERS